MRYKSKFPAYQATIAFYGNYRTLLLLDFHMTRNLNLYSGKAVLLGSIQHYRQAKLITGNKMIFSGKNIGGSRIS